MVSDLAQLNAKLDEVLTLLRGKPKPHMTRVAFARLAGLSVKTVGRKIDRREILTVKGRIPHSELMKFASV